MIRDLLHALRVARSAGVEAWHDARGNPAIEYRYRVGDLVRAPGREPARIVRRCSCDERYDLDNGDTCPGYVLMPR